MRGLSWIQTRSRTALLPSRPTDPPVHAAPPAAAAPAGDADRAGPARPAMRQPVATPGAVARAEQGSPLLQPAPANRMQRWASADRQ